eukprot:scaffold103442_cov52-Attheya_sp.AAC.6
MASFVYMRKMRAQRIFKCLIWMAVAVTIEGEITDLEDEKIVKEAINAGRGHRDEEGTRDQWNSKEHLGEESKFDSRRPISPDVKRLLKTYRLECSGCDHSKAVSLINNYVRTTKLEAQQQARKDWWIDRGLMLAALLVVCAGIARFVVLQKENSGLSVSSLDDKKRSEIQQLRQRHQIASAAVQRKAAAPTWRDNEEKEIWTTKQEKQFQKALREFGGVGKKERYVLIAAEVDGKSRIECLTHHRLQQFREEQQQKDQ